MCCSYPCDKVPLATPEDVAGFGRLIQVKWEFELDRLGSGPVR